MAVKKIYYSMGEVAEMFDVNQSLIRHWESKFDCLKPHKNAKGNRMFTEADVERLKQIYHLVKERGMTLKGAAKVLRQSSQDELKREMELLERLQKVRSLLVEVREELKAGDGEQVLDSAEGVQEVVEPIAEVAPEKEKPAEESAQPKSEETTKRRPAKRRKRVEEEEKELFPFYEQSLF
ncbi:MAG: MerR family transcriptional regulator [Alistipes sp.]|nr:MerR family transcriptional regulator [Alistipes sp.]